MNLGYLGVRLKNGLRRYNLNWNIFIRILIIVDKKKIIYGKRGKYLEMLL